MEIYKEYMNGDRKASVTRIQRGWDRAFDVYEVAMYVNGKPVQRATLSDEPQADNLAEDFVNGSNSGPTLLNEQISNG